jgi:predicted PurR-regulated permease PerM
MDPIFSAILGALLVIAGLLVTVIILIVPVNNFVKNIQNKITSDWMSNISQRHKKDPSKVGNGKNNQETLKREN